MKRRIKLTESDLHNIIKESVKKILKEESDFLTDFDWVSDFRDGIALVELNGKCNFINQNGDILSPNQWFDSATVFKNGFAKVYLNGKGWNFIKQDGEILCNQWFDWVRNFHDGIAYVKLNGKDYVVDERGKLFNI